MNRISVGELVKRAKGEDRSLREYARDCGVDAAILSKMINGTYIPKKTGIYEALTNPQASPRGGVTFAQMIAAANASEDFRNGMSAGMSAGMLTALQDIPSSSMIKVLQARGIAAGGCGGSEPLSSVVKPEEIRRIQRIRSEAQRFTAIANGIILGSLGKKGLTFQLVHADGEEIDGIRFDTCVKLMNHEISEYLIRYAFISDEEDASPMLAISTMRRMVEELVFLKPQRARITSVLLFDLERAMLLKEEYISHYITEDPANEIHLI